MKNIVYNLFKIFSDNRRRIHKQLHKNNGNKNSLILFNHTLPLYLFNYPTKRSVIHKNEKINIYITNKIEILQIMLWPTRINNKLIYGYCREINNQFLILDIIAVISSFLSVKTLSDEKYLSILCQKMMENSNYVSLHNNGNTNKIIQYFNYKQKPYIKIYEANNKNNIQYFLIFPVLQLLISEKSNEWQIHLKNLIAIPRKLLIKLNDISLIDNSINISKSHYIIVGSNKYLNINSSEDVYFIDYKTFMNCDSTLITTKRPNYIKLKTTINLHFNTDIKKLHNEFIENIPNILNTIKQTNKIFQDLFFITMK